MTTPTAPTTPTPADVVDAANLRLRGLAFTLVELSEVIDAFTTKGWTEAAVIADATARLAEALDILGVGLDLI